MIYVCDAVMGSGKTTAIINYINSHPEKKFIYITPYLGESDRIIENCNMIKFETPNGKRGAARTGKYSKLEDARDLVASGKNISSTHALFKTYDSEMLSMITEQGYILIIDENVEVTEKSEDSMDDINMLVKSGYINEEYDEDTGLLSTYSLNDEKEYGGGKFSTFFRMMRSRSLTKIDEDGVVGLQYYWILPPELIESFEDVFVLTYMFEGQGLYNMFKIHDIQYKNIGVSYSGGVYQFDFEHPVNYIPDYIYHLDELIDIVKDPKYNSIGARMHDLSMSWYVREAHGEVNALKRLMRSCFEYKWAESSKGERVGNNNVSRLWGTYAKDKSKLTGKGYTNNYLVFNSRATNKYKNAEYLVYAVNLFVNVADKKYYEKLGVKVSDDQYALSTMIQWIWRSAIRDGKPIHIYIPSRRMRELLIDWMNSFKEAG